MLFSSISFLYFFLPILFILYFSVKDKYRNFVLLAASIFFYFYGEPYYVFLLLGSCVWNYVFARKLESVSGKKRTSIFILGVAVNVILLVFFKYNKRIALPLGISFFTFQTLSYVIDVYRKKVPACTSLRDFSTYVCLFPQLVAGPIVRYTDVCEELKKRTHSFDLFGKGVGRFCIGLGKKVLIANSLGMLFQLLADQQHNSVLGYWVSALAFSLQIYFDFSGYSDMAIGLGRMFGFHFPENFNYPFSAVSITDFWRRWHITLSSWFREYVYIPLGGNRVPTWKWLRNIAAVWMLTGMWHGACWNYVLWGLYFGVILMVEKLFLRDFLAKHRIFSRFYTVFLVLISFVIFSHEDLGQLGQALLGMFGLSHLPLVHPEALYYTWSYALLLLLAIIFSLGIPKKIYEAWAGEKFKTAVSVAEPVFYAAILILVTAFLIDASFNPFLYFRF